MVELSLIGELADQLEMIANLCLVVVAYRYLVGETPVTFTFSCGVIRMKKKNVSLQSVTAAVSEAFFKGGWLPDDVRKEVIAYTNPKYSVVSSNAELSKGPSPVERIKHLYLIQVRVFNGTPHDINIISEDSVTFEPTMRKHVSSEPKVIMSFPSNGMLNAKYDSTPVEVVGGIPTKNKNLVSCDALPQGYDIYIVSGLYQSAVKDLGLDSSKVYTVIDPVFTVDGKSIIGCLAIGQVKA